MSAQPKARPIHDDALAVLSAGRCDGNRFYLPDRQLERKLYERCNDALVALGGKWNRSAKAHVFAEDCAAIIDGAIETGTYIKPGDMGWFPTPRGLARRLVKLAEIQPGMEVLEPSAGEGAIVREIMAAGADVYCIEIDPKRCAALAKLEPWVVQHGDFLTRSIGRKFDRVVMNPPFAARADIHHVRRAYELLKPGGILVAIMAGSVTFREDRLTRDFRELCDMIEPLPPGSFSESGTEVNTAIVRMERRA